MKVNIKIFEENDKVRFKYNKDKIVDLNFEELVVFTRYLLNLDDFKELKEEDMIIDSKPKHNHYKNTFKSLLRNIQTDKELLEILDNEKQKTEELSK